MEHIKVFNSMEEYEAAKASLKDPFVVLEKSSSEVIYSNLVEITEDDLDTTEYIDLGLPSGLKWASCNVGADKPCDYGLLYQWGRTDGYEYNDPNVVNHFLETKDEEDKSKRYDFTMSKHHYSANETLLPEDDAVHAATNGKAHMPTVGDIDELLAGTTNQWCQCTVLGEDHTEHTVYGRLFTSKTNSNKIFIPAAGYFSGSNGQFYYSGSYGCVWSSSCLSAYDAYSLYFYSGYCSRFSYNRSLGYSVRGV